MRGASEDKEKGEEKEARGGRFLPSPRVSITHHLREMSISP